MHSFLYWTENKRWAVNFYSSEKMDFKFLHHASTCTLALWSFCTICLFCTCSIYLLCNTWQSHYWNRMTRPLGDLHSSWFPSHHKNLQHHHGGHQSRDTSPNCAQARVQKSAQCPNYFFFCSPSWYLYWHLTIDNRSPLRWDLSLLTAFKCKIFASGLKFSRKQHILSHD